MEKRQLAGLFLLIGLATGYYIGAYGAATNESLPTGEAVPSTMHTHPTVAVDQTKPVPTVTIEATKDEKDGYNLHLLTTNYRFTPEAVNTEPVSNTGHAHLYVNGVKIARVYSDWFNLSAADMQEGENLIEVTLNANDHSEWMLNDQHISATTTLYK